MKKGIAGRPNLAFALFTAFAKALVPPKSGPRNPRDNTPRSDDHLAKPRDPDRESRQVRRRRLQLGAAAEIESAYGVTGFKGGEFVGYHEGFPRRARRRAAHAKAKRLFLEARA